MGIAMSKSPNWFSFSEDENGNRKLPNDLSSLLDIPGVNIDSILGEGTIGIVVADSSKDKAYKILSPSQKARDRLKFRNQSLEDIFKKEAALVTTSNHLVPRTYGQTSQGQLYIEMPKGKDVLLEKLSENPLDSIMSVAQGINDYHGATNNVYFDIKPENLLYLDGTLRISDLSTPTICAELGDEGRVRSNIGFMYTRAPEVYDETNKPQFQSDVFGLGSLLFKLQTGKYITEDEINSFDKNPDQVKEFYGSFDSKSWEKFLDKKCRENKVPRKIKNILKKSLSLKPEERYNSPKDIVDIINDYNWNKKLKKRTMIFGTLGLAIAPFLFGGQEYRYQQPIGYMDKTDVNIIRTYTGPSFHYEELTHSLKATPELDIPLEMVTNKFPINSLKRFDSDNLNLSPFLNAIIQTYTHTKKKDIRFEEYGIIYPKEYLKEKKKETSICSRAGCYSIKYWNSNHYVYSDGSSEESVMYPTSLRGIESKISENTSARMYGGDYNVRRLVVQMESRITKGGSIDIEDFLVEATLGSNALRNLKEKSQSDYYRDYKNFIFPEKKKFIEVWRNNFLKTIKPYTTTHEEGGYYSQHTKNIEYFTFPKKS